MTQWGCNNSSGTLKAVFHRHGWGAGSGLVPIPDPLSVIPPHEIGFLSEKIGSTPTLKTC